MQAEDLGFGCDRVADEDGRRELPVLAEEDGPGPRHVHGHERVQQPRREPSLHDQTLEARGGRERLVEVKRVVVPGQLGERLHVRRRQGQAAPRLLTDLQG